MTAQPLAKSVAADGKTEIVRIAGKPLLVSAVEFNRLYALNAELLEALDTLLKHPNTMTAKLVARAAITKAKGEES